uniref:Uncharacterized protein n=1 Tax=Glossina austeni TaxID=7395 RepID=A0A1A9UI04_GLOAU
MPIRGRLLKAGGRGPGGGPDGMRMPKPCIPGGRGSGGLKSIGGAKPAKEGTGGPGIDKCACVLAVFGAKATGSATTVVVVAFPVVLMTSSSSASVLRSGISNKSGGGPIGTLKGSFFLTSSNFSRFLVI